MASLHDSLPLRIAQPAQRRHRDNKRPAKNRHERKPEYNVPNVSLKSVEFSIERREISITIPPTQPSPRPQSKRLRSERESDHDPVKRRKRWLSSQIAELASYTWWGKISGLGNICGLSWPKDRWLYVDDQLVKYATFPKRRSSTVFAYLELPREGDFETPEAKDAAKGYANAAALFHLWRPAPMIIFMTQRGRKWIDMLTYSISGPSQHIEIYRHRFNFYDDQIIQIMRGAISAVMGGPDQALS